jgi:amidohydrolase
MTDRDDVRRLRHALHREPDLSGDEGATAARLRDWLAERGLAPVATEIGGHGLLYRVGHGRDGAPVRLLRADLDGLPLTEATGADHGSRRDGRHHACGHDGHMAMLAGALVRLNEDRPDGTVYGLFQPAEETGEGMARCLEDGRLADLSLDACYAIHNFPGVPLGQVLVREGVQAVASTGLRIRFTGATCHAAEPGRGRNPIPMVARLVPVVLASPGDREEAVAAIVGIAGGGERYGTSAGDAAIFATLRAAGSDDLDAMVEGVVAEAEHMADDADVELAWDRVEPFPATRNHPDAVAVVRRAAGATGLTVVAPERPFGWSEDFGHATARWPGALIGLGAGTGQPDLHSPRYDFPDELLEQGVALWVALGGAP